MKIRISIFIGLVAGIIAGCTGINRDPYSDTPTTGIISIGVDETFRPVADAELLVFEGLYQYAKITPIYSSESQCFKLLMEDSVRLIIASRPLYENEKTSLQKRQIIPREIKIAVDAIAVIANPGNADTLLSLKQVREILTGNVTEWKQISQQSALGKIEVIFDNKNSSILRYLLDSLCSGTTLSSQLYALDSNIDVVNYIANHLNAIGFIGVSWISDQDDTTQMSFLNRIHVIALSEKNQATSDNSYKPYQAYIYQGIYPLSRNVYAINTEPRNGLATGVMSFLASDKGQKIILKSGIVPATAPVRLVKIRDRF